MSEGLDDCTQYEGKDGYALVDKFQYEAVQKQWESQRQELLGRIMALELENENLRRQERGEGKMTKPQMAMFAVSELLKASAIEAEHPNLRRKHTVKLNVTVDSTEVEFEVESTAHEDEIKEAAERAVRSQIHVEWEIADQENRD